MKLSPPAELRPVLSIPSIPPTYPLSKLEMDTDSACLTSALTSRGLSITDHPASSPHLTLLSITDLKRNAPATLRLRSFTAKSDLSPAFDRMNTVRKLHQSTFVEIYDCFTVENSPKSYLLAVETEPTPHDLPYDVTLRAHKSPAYSEPELFQALHTLTDALAAAQEAALAHSHLRPCNVYLVQGCYKLGGFDGDAHHSESDGETTYLSPALRRNTGKAYHNKYKSDVYSLGVTVFYMANGGTVSGVDLPSAVARLPYSDTFCRYLQWVLATEESSRPDFVELRRNLRSFYRSPGTGTVRTCEHLNGGETGVLAGCGHVLCAACAYGSEGLCVCPMCVVIGAQGEEGGEEGCCAECGEPDVVSNLECRSDGGTELYYHQNCLGKKRPSVWRRLLGTVPYFGVLLFLLFLLRRILSKSALR